MRRLRIFTWHVNGRYLYYLSHLSHDIYVPVKPGRPPAYDGLPTGGFPWPDNLQEVPVDDVAHLPFDCLLFQSPTQWDTEQHLLLSDAQRRLPRIYLEHDPPRLSPTDTRHAIDDPNVLLVHVTPFNALMWDSGRTPTRMIDHGVTVPAGVRYTGEIKRALAVVNDITTGGRQIGADVLETIRAHVPVDLVGRGSLAAGGLGELPHGGLCEFEAHYRIFFNPIRYTSLELAVCEAMMIGMPIVGLGTAEMAMAVQNGVSGYVDTNLRMVVTGLHRLLADRRLARHMGENARRYALERFNISRFARDWDDALALVTDSPQHRRSRRDRAIPASGDGRVSHVEV